MTNDRQAEAAATLLVSYRTRGATSPWRAGIAQEGNLVDAQAFQPPSAAAAEPAVGAVRGLIERGQPFLEDLFAWAKPRLAAGRQTIPLATLELGPPVPDPEKIICLGINYRDHSTETNIAKPAAPMFFGKFRNSLAGPSDPILLPRVSDEIDFEGELAVVIGARCKDVTEADALRAVAGYTIMNDVSARDVQFRTSQWMAGKILDTFAPMGPGIALASALPDPQALVLTTLVNGAVAQQANTSQMIFSVAAAIAYLSSLLTLVPGDIIATGTPAGVGHFRTPPSYLRDGDVVEVAIAGIGRIRNRVTGPRS